jgi:carbamoyltransferase
MGLAPYGKPAYLEQMRKIVLLQPDGSFKLNLACFRHHNEKVEYEWEGGTPSVGTLFAQGLVDLLGPARGKDEPLTQHHKDIARSVQAMVRRGFLPSAQHLARAPQAGRGGGGGRLRDEFGGEWQDFAEDAV